MYKHLKCMRNTWRTLHMLRELHYSCHTIRNENVCLYAIEWDLYKFCSHSNYLMPAIFLYHCLCDALTLATYPIFIPRFVSMRIAKHFICIPYHLIYPTIILCLFCFIQSLSVARLLAPSLSLSLSLALYPFVSLYHRYVYVSR